MTDINVTAESLTWGAPPPPVKQGRFGMTQQFVEVLKSRPGEWALYPKRCWANSAAQNTRRYPGTQWVSRTFKGEGQNQAHIYARWVGGEAES